MNRRIARVAVAWLTAILPTIITYRLLSAEQYLPLLLAYSTVVVVLSTIASQIPKGPIHTISRVGAVVLQILVALLIAFSLNVTPSSAYLAWFRLVQSGEISGVLSFMFTLKACFFSTAAGVAILKRNIVASILASVSLILLVLYAVFQQQPVMLTAIALAASATIVTAIGLPDRRIVRRVVPILQVLVVSGAIAFPLSLTTVANYSPIADLMPTDVVTEIIVRVFPNFPFLYNMPGYGHRLGENEIGGTPSLTGRPVFRVTGEPGETVYLRTATHDYFTGKGWAQSTVRSSEQTGERSTPRGYFTAEAPANYDRPLRVEIVIDFFSSVPHTLDTDAINFFKGDFPPFIRSGFDTGFLFQFPIVRGTVFYLDRATDKSGALIPASGSLPTNLGSYMQLPTAIPEEVRALARALDSGSPLTTAENIRRYLASNFYYSLNSPVPRGDESPAWSFLMGDGSGYCVHFATAFVLLSRLAGIPARYVTGFLVNIPNNSDTAEVPGFSAHAWAEIWTAERGWMTQEATPPMLPGYFDDPAYYEWYDPFASAYTGRQLELILGDRLPERPDRPRKPARRIDPVPIVIVFASIATVSALIWFFVGSSHAPGSRRRRLRLAAKSLLKRSLRKGANDPGSVGWNRWAESVTSSEDLHEAAQIIQGTFFGGHEVTIDEIRRLRRLKKRIGEHTRRTAEAVNYTHDIKA